MVATIDIYKGSLLETSYYNVYFNIILAGSITLESSTQINLGIIPKTGFVPTPDQAAMELHLFGTGFTFNAGGDVTGGTINKVEFYNTLGFIAELNGYPIDAVELFNAFETAQMSFNLDPIFDILYNRVPYVVNGSEEGDYFGAAHLSDTFYGNGGPDELSGAGGNDTIHGGTGNDKLNGGDGDDTINGDEGRDIITGNAGNDTLNGGADDDIFRYETGTDNINGGAGTDFLSYIDAPGGSGPFTIDISAATVDRAGHVATIASIEGIIGNLSTDGDVFIGNSADNIFVPNGFHINVDGKGGHDRLVFYRHDDYFGAPTRDSSINVNAVTGKASTSSVPDNVSFTNIESFAGSHFADTFLGSARDEEFLPMQGADTVDGGGGIDTLSYALEQVVPDSGTTKIGAVVDLAASTATDTGGKTDTISNFENVTGSTLGDNLSGDSQANVLKGLDGTDFLQGRGDNDTLEGGGDNDILIGQTGNDTLDGGPGADYLNGGEGNDSYRVDDTFDRIDEGFDFPQYGFGGIDTLTSTASWFWDVYGVADIVRIDESVAGMDTTIVGGIWDNDIYGNSGTNILFGRGGSDTYRPGAGVDFVSFSTLGLTDANAYAGVNGVNTLVMEVGNGYDVVFEFETGRDKIDLSAFGLADYAALQALGTNDGLGNSYFALGPTGTDYLYLVGLELADLSAADFVLS